MNRPQNDPYDLPRPFSVVVAILARRHGIHISEQNARHVERAALRKLAALLAPVEFPPDRPHSPTTQEARP